MELRLYTAGTGGGGFHVWQQIFQSTTATSRPRRDIKATLNPNKLPKELMFFDF